MKDCKLQAIIDRQRQFSELYHKFDELTLAEREQLTIQYTSLLSKELGEVLDEINYKPHSSSVKQVNIDALQIELIDVFKYLINLMLIWNINEAKVLAELFHYKSAIVEERAKNGKA